MWRNRFAEGACRDSFADIRIPQSNDTSKRETQYFNQASLDSQRPPISLVYRPRFRPPWDQAGVPDRSVNADRYGPLS